jgi:enhancing lycopene biosynthesis protein 2
MPRLAVLISGCGHRDGAEIHETVMALFGLERAGAQLVCLSREKHVCDHSGLHVSRKCHRIDGYQAAGRRGRSLGPKQP